MAGENTKEPVIIYRRVGSENFFLEGEGIGAGGVWSLDIK